MGSTSSPLGFKQSPMGLELRPRGKPYVFVSGDNSNSIFCLVPNSEAASDWTYTKVELAFLGADIGRASIADTDGDGFVEIYVPAYDNDVIAVFKLGPK